MNNSICKFGIIEEEEEVKDKTGFELVINRIIFIITEKIKIKMENPDENKGTLS